MKKVKYKIWDDIEKQMVNVQNLEFDNVTGELIAATVWRFNGKDTYPVQFTVNGKREAFLIEYTGFKDKNGKEIFEGDIVKYKQDPALYIIKWIDDKCQFKAVELDSDFGIDYLINGNLEIVGNIYENTKGRNNK